MSEEKVETPKETCLLTLVTPGSSDRVLKVFPAEHKSERIFLDNTPGIERWEAVKRTIYNYAVKGDRVPEPVPYHNGKDLNRVTLKNEEIPTVFLENAELRAPKQESALSPKVKLEDSKAVETEKRIGRLEDSVLEISKNVSKLLESFSRAGRAK